jgi:ubiquinone/menaquinone biosynthesis C-methylase UbiE
MSLWASAPVRTHGAARRAVPGKLDLMQPTPAFAADPRTGAYYDSRASEYDEWYTSGGLFAARERPGWDDEVAQVAELVRSLPAVRTLDVACGTGFLTRHLPGYVVGIDQSPAMVAIAQSRLPAGLAIIGDALRLVFADGAFDRIFTGHFYGHLPGAERQAFLAEARRVAGELIVVDSALRPGAEPEQWQERVLNDGSRHRVYKRYFSSGQLAGELDGETLLDGSWFVAARVSLR